MRKIIHIDMDCFYAAIEMRDFPHLANKPLAVGGDANKRGVISTCNYAARKFGIHSAMATGHALKLCPNLVLQATRMDQYREDSSIIREIFANYTSLIEPLSLDEAFLDVSHCQKHFGSATYIAQAIREEIFKQTKLTASAGVAPNKSLAKIASDWHKPNGQKVITPEEIPEFMRTLSVRKLFGVGPKTEEKLTHLHIKTCAQLQSMSLLQLTNQFGTFGERLYKSCRGIDEREVNPERVRKSISVEETYVKDLNSIELILTKLPLLIERLEIRIKRHKEKVFIHNLFVKIKFKDFTQTTVESRAENIDLAKLQQLFATGWQRKLMPVRLLGIGIRLNTQEESEDRSQLGLPGFNENQTGVEPTL